MAGKSAAQARALALLRQVGLEEKRSRCRRSSPAASSSGWPSPAPASSPQIILFDEPPRRSTRR